MIPGFPTVIFDGQATVVGGGGSMYNQYLTKYNAAIAVPSSFTIDVEGSNSGMIDYELNITVEKTATASTDSPKMHVVVTESHIPEIWGGLTEVNYVERTMVPNQNGTTLDFSSATTQDVTLNFSVDPSWVNENCELVIFLQNNGTKEILQAIKRDLSEFGTTNTLDASILGLNVPQSLCNSSMIPQVTFANYGLEDLTSLNFCIYVNDVATCTLPWTGTLGYLESTVITFPEISNYTIEAVNNITVEAENPNGQPDQYPSNNTFEVVVNEAPDVFSPVSLALKLDDNPGEITWEVLDSDGDQLYSGGPYTNAGQYLIEQFDFTDPDCYSFVIYDAGGDGLTGSGWYKIVYDGNTVIGEGDSFGSSDEVQFGIGLVGVEDQELMTGFNVFPNPVENDASVHFNLQQSETVSLKVFNAIGEVIYSGGERFYNEGTHNIAVRSESLESGLYFFHLELGDESMVQKVIVK